MKGPGMKVGSAMLMKASLIAELMLLAPAVQAAPTVTYAEADAFVRQLTAVEAEGPTTLSSLPRTREINGLEARAEVLFKKPGMSGPFRACVDAAFWAREFRWTQVSAALPTSREPDAVEISRIARAGFRFGEAYRRCRIEVDALDTSQKPGPGRIIDASTAAIPARPFKAEPKPAPWTSK